MITPSPLSPGDRSIHLNERDRFVATPTLRGAYLRYEESRNPSALNYVSLEDGLELGIVASAVPELARGISSLLCRSLEDARDDRGGHLPVAVGQAVQALTQPLAVAPESARALVRFVREALAGPARG